MQIDRFKDMTNEQTGMLRCPTCKNPQVSMVQIQDRKRTQGGRVVEMEFNCVEGHRFMLEFMQSTYGVTFELWEGRW